MSLENFFIPYQALNNLPGQKVAVLAPHPDDEIFGCGGSLAALVQQGADVHVAVVSDGANHGSSEATPEIRMSESLKAANLLGYPPPQFWKHKDSQLLDDKTLLPAIETWLTELQPDLLIAPSLWEMHRDHRAVAIAAIEAIHTLPETARLAMYEVGVPLFPNTLVDITENFNLKNDAMHCFKTQLVMQPYAQQITGLNAYRSYTLGNSVKYAEAFHMLTRDEALTFKYSLTPRQHVDVLHQAEKLIGIATRNTETLLAQLNLNEQLKELQTHLLANQNKLTQALEDKERLHLLHQDLLKQQKILITRCNQTESKVIEKDHLINMIFQSTSWRLTAPLRKLSELLRKHF